MQIDLPATLSARYDAYDSDYNKIDGAGRVVVSFGPVEVTELVAVRTPNVYYDTSTDEGEEDLVASETVAKWLREKLA